MDNPPRKPTPTECEKRRFMSTLQQAHPSQNELHDEEANNQDGDKGKST